jgi:hypothetical protein
LLLCFVSTIRFLCWGAVAVTASIVLFLEVTDAVKVLLFILGIEVSDLKIAVEVFSFGLQERLESAVQLLEALTAVLAAHIAWPVAFIAVIIRVVAGGVI